MQIRGKFNNSVRENVKYKVDVRITRRSIEDYYKKKRIYSHRRLYENLGDYSTNINLMPSNHKKKLVNGMAIDSENRQIR